MKIEVINLAYPHDLKKSAIVETVAAIGSFDGIHRGHQKVIEVAVTAAKKQGKKSAVITFFPHPSVVLKRAEKEIKYITPESEKIRILAELQVDLLYIIHFNEELSQLKPSEFIESFIVGLHVTHLVAGFDFSFAHKGVGNMNNIHEFSGGRFTTEIVRKVEGTNGKVGSSQIREFLKSGDIAGANAELGRPFSNTGIVVEGDRRGRTIGFPTANLEVAKYALLPRQGVYAVKVVVSGKVYKGMANLGVVPTFKVGVTEPTLEVYILDFDADIYGEELLVLWYSHIRDEKKFSGIEEIIAQLTADEKMVREIFS